MITNLIKQKLIQELIGFFTKTSNNNLSIVLK